MNTRRYRLNRLALALENQGDVDALRLARIIIDQALAERTAPGIAPIAPEALAALFAAEPSAAWAALSSLTDSQLVNEAIEYAVYLEQLGVEKKWISIYDCWVRKIADRAAEWADLLTRAEAGQLAEQAADEGLIDAEEPAVPTAPSANSEAKAAQQIAEGVAHGIRRIDNAYLVPSASSAATYRVEDGRCSCKAGRHGRGCWHVAAVEQLAAA